MSEQRGGDRRTPQQHQAAQERAAQMAALQAEGLTLASIAREFGLSRQRVHAILATFPPQPIDNGANRVYTEST